MTTVSPELTAAEVVERLGLEPHPEGGHYKELYRHAPDGGGRGACTSIYYLLAAGERSHWHRVRDAVEIWHYHAGAPLALSISEDARTVRIVTLAGTLADDTQAQAVVPPDAWQSAESLGDWTLVGCAVAPAFEFASFELAPPDWAPGH